MDIAIGAIGLSIQVIGTAVKIKRMIDCYRSASEDIRRLGAKVDRVEAICRSIGTRLQAKDGESRSLSLIQLTGPDILRSIAGTLVKLEQILKKVEEKDAKKGALQTLGMVFLRKKELVHRLSRDLDDDLGDLQYLMTTDVFSRVEAIHLQFDGLLSSPLPQKPNPDGPAQIAGPLVWPGVRTKVERRTVEITWAFNFYILWTFSKITKISQPSHLQPTATTHEERTYSLGHCRLPYRIEVVWHFGSFTPTWCTLRIPHNITNQSNHHLCKEVVNAIDYREDDDMSRFRELLSSRKISLATTVNNYTLFELAVMMCRPDIYVFLIQQAPHLVSAHAPPHWCLPGLFRNDRFRKQEIQRLAVLSDILRICVEVSAGSFLVSEFRFVAGMVRTPGQLDCCFEKFRPEAAEDWAEFIDCAWDQTVILFCRSWSSDESLCHDYTGRHFEEWKRLFYKILVEGSVDTHKGLSEPADVEGGSALLNLVIGSPCPVVLGTYLEKWVEILQYCGVDVQSYLECEIFQCETGFCDENIYYYDKHSPREICFERVLGFKMPTWRRWVDPTGHALEIRREFRMLGPEDMYHGCNEFELDQIRRHCEKDRPRAWKRLNLESWDRNWPFFLPAWSREVAWFDFNPRWKTVVSSFREVERLAATRFQRRQMKRLCRKERFTQRPGAMMPGSWPEI